MDLALLKTQMSKINTPRIILMMHSFLKILSRFNALIIFCILWLEGFKVFLFFRVIADQI
jgi:hypothetical protein